MGDLTLDKALRSSRLTYTELSPSSHSKSRSLSESLHAEKVMFAQAGLNSKPFTGFWRRKTSEDSDVCGPSLLKFHRLTTDQLSLRARISKLTLYISKLEKEFFFFVSRRKEDKWSLKSFHLSPSSFGKNRFLVNTRATFQVAFSRLIQSSCLQRYAFNVTSRHKPVLIPILR